MNLEHRIQKLEEEICWIKQDILNLIKIIESVKPEQHTHYTNVFYTYPSTELREDF
jgi:hypothetical protein